MKKEISKIKRNNNSKGFLSVSFLPRLTPSAIVYIAILSSDKCDWGLEFDGSHSREYRLNPPKGLI